MKYKTLHSTSIETLDTMVNEKLNEGWDLYGDLIVVLDGPDRVFYQGMLLMTEGDF